FFFALSHTPRSTLFPSTTLFRSASRRCDRPEELDEPRQSPPVAVPTEPSCWRENANRRYKSQRSAGTPAPRRHAVTACGSWARRDRKSTRLNSSHVEISYAVFCL